MISYLVLCPPGGPDRNHQSTLFVADKVTWLGLFFPWIWLAVHRLWLASVLSLVCDIAGIVMMQLPGLGWAGVLTIIASHLLVAIEGRNFYILHLGRKGWTVADLIAAPDLLTAEDMFFSVLPSPHDTPLPQTSGWAHQNDTKATGWDQPAYGLFDQTGAR